MKELSENQNFIIFRLQEHLFEILYSLKNCAIKKKDEFDNIPKEAIRKWRDISKNAVYQLIDIGKVGEKVQEKYNVATLRSRGDEQFKVWLTPRISN